MAFELSGRQIASASARNQYTMGNDGSATQSLGRTWSDCVSALRGLADKVKDLGARTAAIAVTGQGDGTWLVGSGNLPICDAWLWLDARAAPTVNRLNRHPDNRLRFEATGTGLNTCQQGRSSRIWTAICPSFSIVPGRPCIARIGSISISPAFAQPIRRRRASLLAISARAATIPSSSTHSRSSTRAALKEAPTHDRLRRRGGVALAVFVVLVVTLLVSWAIRLTGDPAVMLAQGANGE